MLHPRKPGKRCIFIVLFLGLKIILEKGLWSRKALTTCLTQAKNVMCMADRKEN